MARGRDGRQRLYHSDVLNLYMTSLYLSEKPVETVFSLIGNDENAMTASLGWVLTQCPALLKKLLEKLGIAYDDGIRVDLQKHSSGKGFTDIEILLDNKFHIIIEAKKGFNVPDISQLEKYALRLNDDKKSKDSVKLLIVLAESDRKDEWLNSNLPNKVMGIEINPISWQEIRILCQDVDCRKESSHSEKRLLQQFYNYIGKELRVQNLTSNSVYVVSLGRQIFFDEQKTKDGKPISFIDVVEKYEMYFHPVGGGKGGWPVDPPNYIAFRYNSALQSIHHIDNYRKIDDYSTWFPLKSPTPTEQLDYLYSLGSAIVPPKRVSVNDREKKYPAITYSSRRWSDLDLLLTCESIAEAVFKTKTRHA